MTVHRSLRIVLWSLAGTLLATGALTGCNKTDPSIRLTGVDFVGSSGVHFPSTMRNSSYLLPAGLPGQVRITFTSDVHYPTCTLDFDGRARLAVTEPASQATQVVAKQTGALLPSSKVSGTLTCVQDTAGSIPQSSSFVATIALTPMVTATPPSLSFGSVAVGATSPEARVVVTSTGSAPAKIDALGYPRASYSIGTDTCTGRTLKVGTSCSFRIAFAPKTKDAISGSTLTISLGGNALVSPAGVTLDASVDRGEGVFTVSPTRLDFDVVYIGSTAEKTLTVSNTGTGALYLKYLTLATQYQVQYILNLTQIPVATSLSDFSIAADDCAGRTLAPGEACQTRVRFTPTYDGGLPVDFFLLYFGDSTVTWDLSTIVIPAMDLFPYRVTVSGMGRTAPPTPVDPHPTGQPHG